MFALGLVAAVSISSWGLLYRNLSTYCGRPLHLSLFRGHDQGDPFKWFLKGGDLHPTWPDLVISISTSDSPAATRLFLLLASFEFLLIESLLIRVCTGVTSLVVGSSAWGSDLMWCGLFTQVYTRALTFRHLNCFACDLSPTTDLWTKSNFARFLKLVSL